MNNPLSTNKLQSVFFSFTSFTGGTSSNKFYPVRVRASTIHKTIIMNKLTTAVNQVIPSGYLCSEYEKLVEDFTFFLATTGFASTTIATRGRNLREFLHYLESQGLTTVTAITNHHLQNFMTCQERRENLVFGCGLKQSTLNQYGSLLNKLTSYLHTYRNQHQLTISLPYREPVYKERQTLSYEEVAELFAFTAQKLKRMRKQLFYSQRNRAMLCIYYCCGLRKSEGVNLDVKDIQSDRLMIHVRKGKGNRSRYVPTTLPTMQILTEYMSGERSRILQLSENKTESFFISEFGFPCTGQSMSAVFKSLIHRCNNAAIRAKQPTLHTLRHSIATHLLQQGMDIVLIQKFLGHKTLDTTQIYTHLINE